VPVEGETADVNYNRPRNGTMESSLHLCPECAEEVQYLDVGTCYARAGFTIGLLVGLAIWDVAIWAAMAIGHGFVEFVLGWMPDVILGCIAGFLWPLAVLGIILLIAGRLRRPKPVT
jgi:hypothetical protein